MKLNINLREKKYMVNLDDLHKTLKQISETLLKINERSPVITMSSEIVIINNTDDTFFYDSNGKMITTDTPDTVYLFRSSITRLDYINNHFIYPHGIQIYSVDGSTIQRFFETKELTMEYLNSFL